MRILLVAHAGLFADAFARSLAQIGKGVHVTLCDPARALDRHLEPQLIVLDADAMEERAAAVVAHFRERFPFAPVVALGNELQESLFAALTQAGVSAYMPKSYRESQTLGVLRAVLEGERHTPPQTGMRTTIANTETPAQLPASQQNPYGLTEAELETLSLLCQGFTNLDIAKARHCKEGTVKAHLHKIYPKLGVANRGQALRVGQRLDEVRELDKQRAGHKLSLRYWLLPHMKPETKRQGELLFRKGDPGRTMYFIQQGRIALPEIGVEMGEGDLFGEIGIFTPQHARTCTARCETDAKLFSLTADQAERLFFEQPQFAYHITQLIASRLQADSSRSR